MTIAVQDFQAHLSPAREGRQAMLTLFNTRPHQRMICGTGHRPQDIPGFVPRDFPVLTFIAEQALKVSRPDVVIAGGAIGWDQALAQAALNLGLPLALILPFAAQHVRWGTEEQQRALSHVKRATIVYAASEPDLQSRSEVVQALLSRNVEMLRYASGVLPFHNGKESGGTAACLKEAGKRGVRVLENTYPAWMAYQNGSLGVIHEVSGTPLSNFSPVDVKFAEVVYPSVEHAYQAAKTTVLAEREQIQQAPTAAQAKKLGRSVTLRGNWDAHKLRVMEALLRQKFNHPEYRGHLVTTGDHLIIEGNTWNDTFFGVCRGLGENHLGRLLMKLREEAKPAVRPPPSRSLTSLQR